MVFLNMFLAILNTHPTSLSRGGPLKGGRSSFAELCLGTNELVRRGVCGPVVEMGSSIQLLGGTEWVRGVVETA